MQMMHKQIPVYRRRNYTAGLFQPVLEEVGYFFVNSSSTNDEIISNNRALVYSMLF